MKEVFLHKSQVLKYILAAFMAGVGAASFFALDLQVVLGLFLLGTFILAGSSYKGTFKDTAQGIRRRKFGFLAGCLVIICAVGVYRYNDAVVDHGLLIQFADRTVGPANDRREVPVILRGYVDGDFSSSPASGRFPFQVKELISGGDVFEIDERTLVVTQKYPAYRYGETLVLNGDIQTPQNFDTFDYVAYLKQQGIRTIAHYPEIRPDAENLPLGFFERTRVAIYKKIFAIRDRFERAVNVSIGEPAAAFVNGILLGTRQNISEELKKDFQVTGTSHILAISGYNISIIAQAILLGLVFFFRRRQAFWVTFAIIILFTVMTGASASVVRAAVMGLLLLFASSYGRLSKISGAILLAGGAMVWFNPMTLRFDAGFQLSFLAVLGLVYLEPLIAPWFKKLPLPDMLKEILGATVCAQIAVFPLLAFYFGSISLVALPVNILILPFVPAVMLFGFLAGLGGMLFVPLGKLLGIFAWMVAGYQLWVIELFAGFPFASLSISISWITMLLLYAVIIFGTIWYRRPAWPAGRQNPQA